MCIYNVYIYTLYVWAPFASHRQVQSMDHQWATCLAAQVVAGRLCHQLWARLAFGVVIATKTGITKRGGLSGLRSRHLDGCLGLCQLALAAFLYL